MEPGGINIVFEKFRIVSNRGHFNAQSVVLKSSCKNYRYAAFLRLQLFVCVLSQANFKVSCNHFLMHAGVWPKF